MNGRTWRIATMIDGEWVPFAGAREESLTLSLRTVDRTGSETDGYRHARGVAGGQFNLNLSGVAIVGPAFARLQNAVTDRSSILIQANAFDAVLRGYVTVDGYSESAPNAQAVQFSTTFQSTGRYLYVTGDDARLLRAAAALHQFAQFQLHDDQGAQ